MGVGVGVGNTCSCTVVLVGVQRHKTPAVIGRGRRGREKHREAQRRKPEKVSQVLILYHLQRSVTRETELAATSLVSDIHSIFCGERERERESFKKEL